MKWFENWFDSPYYHLLYRDRNENEAQKFIDNLIEKIPLCMPATLLDLACGKGRHSRYLARKGFEVWGLDLSPKSIAYAQQFESKNLHFVEGDMRDFEFEMDFNFVLNLFTSFGYFENDTDDLLVFQNIHKQLKNNGLFIQDYLNADIVAEHLIKEEVKVVEGISFHLNRKIEGAYVIKDIRFEDGGSPYHFQERVKLYKLNDFEKFAKDSHLQIEQVFGDYELNTYEPKHSQRIIIKYQKI